jgi:nucleoside 2-deoxyribosyltransferase
MKYYFAARFSKRVELRRYRAQLTRLGHVVTSRWLDGKADENAATASRDLADIDTADVCIWFTEQPRSATRGGRHFEAGYAAGRGKNLIIVGPVEHIFCHLGNIERFGCWPECLAAFSAGPCGSTRHRASAVSRKGDGRPHAPQSA